MISKEDLLYGRLNIDIVRLRYCPFNNLAEEKKNGN
jgi:hypothetical protein